ncbi:hypothetical protein Tco_0562571 [Tanacetum coccineum]
MATQAFNIKNGMSMLVQKSQDHKKEKDHKMMIRDCAWLMFSKKFKIYIQVKPIRTSSGLISMNTTTYHKLKIEVKDYKLKTKSKHSMLDIVQPSRKLSLVKEAEHVKKAKRVRRPAKKSTTTPTTGVVLGNTLGVSVSKKKAPAKADRSKGIEILSDVALSEAAQLKEATKRSKKDFHISQESGSGNGTNFESGVPDEKQRKSSGTDEGTDDNDDLNDDDNDDDNANDDENPSFTLKDYDEEEHDEEYESNDEYENVFEEENGDLYKDVDVRSLGAEHENERKGDEDMIDADQNVSQEQSYEKVIEDAHVTLTALQNTNDSKQSSFVSLDFANQFLILEKAPPSDHEVASLMNIKMSYEVSST